MKINIKSIIALVSLSLFFSCKKTDNTSEESASAIDSTTVYEATSDTMSVNANVSSSAAVVDPNSDRKFVRTADLKFKVKNVLNSTTKIEDATRKFGGFVTQTNLETVVNNQERNKINADSTLLVTKYGVENNITIRVPNTQLDTIIKIIAKEIQFLDHRLIKADDVTLQMLSNKMSHSRGQKSEDRLENAIDEKGKKIDQIVEAEAQLDQKREQKDNSKLQNLSLNDQVNFSTLTILIYQDLTIKKEVVANIDDNKQYAPHLGIKIWDSLKTGWYILEGLFVFLISLWPIFLLGFLGYIVYKKYRK